MFGLTFFKVPFKIVPAINVYFHKYFKMTINFNFNTALYIHVKQKIRIHIFQRMYLVFCYETLMCTNLQNNQ